MVSISDILNKDNTDPVDQPGSGDSASPKQDQQAEGGIEVSKFVSMGVRSFDSEQCLKLYADALALVKDIYDRAQNNQELIDGVGRITACVEKFVDQQLLANDNILKFITDQKDEANNYIYEHVVNVCIISIEIGIGLKLERGQMIELATVAILHDIGMVKFRGIYSKKGILTAEEYDQIKNHPALSAQILQKFKNIDKRFSAIVAQEHERLRGSGYPRGLKGSNIDKFAQIIGISDVFEAMTHARPYRGRIDPLESLRQLLKEKTDFAKDIIKILIQRFGCPYCLGTHVKLTSGERGRIIGRNLVNSMRPVVELTHDIYGRKLKDAKVVDLAQNPTASIEKILQDKEE
ncbi:HD-GYP domain-containing protein [Candidatus Omnitrophota bacterium]